MDKRLSLKFSIISFLLLIGVVVGHGVNIKYASSGSGFAVWFIESFLSTRLIKVIIPTFFFMSAYLFFLSFDVKTPFSLGTFTPKISKRFRTLGIPYVFWCAFWFIFWYVMQKLPGISAYFGNPLSDMPLEKQFWTMFIEPINYPFWFIRELIMYVVITPLLYLYVKYFRIIGLLLLYIVAGIWFSLFTVWDVEVYRIHMIFWFCFGIYCSIHKINLRLDFQPWFQLLLVIVSLSLLAFTQIFELRFPNYGDFTLYRIFSNIISLVACVTLWSTYDFLDKRMNFSYHNLYAFGFIIYAVHGIPILLLKEGIVKVLNPSPGLALGLYFATIAAMILACIGFGMLFKKVSPRFYGLVTGNR